MPAIRHIKRVNPHIHVSLISKAAANAIALADALVKHKHDVVKALKAWEPAQLAYGNQLLQYGQMLGVRVALTKNYDKGKALI